MEKNIIIGTAGHIDHGKTTLIKALTGTDTDRLKEEKKRGISIDLGFTGLTLSDGMKVGIIDVPGHEKFIKNMLAGAGGVDLALLVIAADEGIMPQTEEHLAIFNLLNIKKGIVIITKIDLVSKEWLELVSEDIKDSLKGSFLENAPIIKVSSIKGIGISELKGEIESMIKTIPAKEDRGDVYFPIDRVFVLQGYGTVVTGTLIKGKIKKGDLLEIYPEQIKVRVRSLQVHQQQVETAFPGQRVGINLAGVDAEKIERGDVLATEESLVITEYLDAQIKILSSLDFVIKHGDRIRLHLGANEIIGRVYLLNKKELYPEDMGLIQLKLEEKVVANFKERFILRRYSPMVTIGGGEILATNPIRHRRFDKTVNKALLVMAKGSAKERLEMSLKSATKKTLDIDDLIKKTSLVKDEVFFELKILKEQGKIVELDTGKESTWLHNEKYELLKKEIITYLSEYHQKYHLRQGMSKEEIRSKLSINLSLNEYNFVLNDLKKKDKIKDNGVTLSLSSFQIKYDPTENKIKQKIITMFLDNKFTPPSINNVLSEYENKDMVLEIIGSLSAENVLIKVEDRLFFHFQAIKEAEILLKKYLRDEGNIEMGQFRDLLNNSRKYALPLLEYFDKEGITIRKGDKRFLAS